MSERKVLNKYYPPDFDPSKIPKLRLPRNRQYSIRIMSPFNMRCNTCGEYIYKGKKFNSRKETVEEETYLGLFIFRFYIKCPRCVAEISFKTDPHNTDYELEGGATRNFEAMRTAEIQAKKEQAAIEEDEANNPMKVLENRTKASQQEMEMIETLEELRDLNSRNAKVDHNSMVELHKAYEEQLAKLQDEEDEQFIQQAFGSKSESKETMKRIKEEDEEEETDQPSLKKHNNNSKPTDFLTKGSDDSIKIKKSAAWEKSVGSSGLNTKKALAGLVRRKPTTPSGLSLNDVDTSQSAASSSQSTTLGGATAPPAEQVKKTNAESEKKTEDTSTVTVPGPSGLGLLAGYSGSESDSNESS